MRESLKGMSFLGQRAESGAIDSVLKGRTCLDGREGASMAEIGSLRYWDVRKLNSD